MAPRAAVLLVGNFLSASLGVRSVCEDLAEHLASAGWPVLTTSTKRPRLARLLDMLQTVWRRRREYGLAQVDVYSGPAFVWAELVCQALRLLHKPYILTLHGGNLPVFARRWPGRVRRLLASAAVVTTPSRYLMQAMRPYRAELRLLPNPLDVGRYTYCRRERARPRLVWLRSFHAIYNPTLAPKIVALLAANYPAIELAMVGPDRGDGSLQATKQAAADLGVASRITMPGGVRKAEIGAWMNQGDIFINTANIDNTPVSVLEAMACGLCVVSTNVGGIPHLVTHAHDALLVPPGDPTAMVNAVRCVLDQPGVARHLSENARASAECFDWSVILPQWQSLLCSVGEEARL